MSICVFLVSYLLIICSLPRIENALPGRDGYEVEIFGMEGIPAPDVADYKRRKEIELGLNPGTISQPPNKRPKVENRPLSEEELRAQLAAHKALMGAGEPAPASTPVIVGDVTTVSGAFSVNRTNSVPALFKPTTGTSNGCWRASPRTLPDAVGKAATVATAPFVRLISTSV